MAAWLGSFILSCTLRSARKMTMTTQDTAVQMFSCTFHCVFPFLTTAADGNYFPRVPTTTGRQGEAQCMLCWCNHQVMAALLQPVRAERLYLLRYMDIILVLWPLHRLIKALGGVGRKEERTLHQSMCSYDISFIPGTRCAASLMMEEKVKGTSNIWPQ